MIRFERAHDIQHKTSLIVDALRLHYINPEQVVCVRSKGSKTRAYARCWEFPRIWQLALDTPPHYIIEVISERFDKLPDEEKEKVLIHELLHIPQNFSGHIRPHGKHLGKYLDRQIDHLHRSFKANISNDNVYMQKRTEEIL